MRDLKGRQPYLTTMKSEITTGAKAAPSPRSGKPELVPPPRLVPITFSDRGRATFFHGRERDLRAFHELRTGALRSNGGTVFLIQGAPGAGKSALLHQCARRAAQDGWRVAEITHDALYDPDALAGCLGVPYATKTTARWTAALSSVAAICPRATGKRSTAYAAKALGNVLKQAAAPHGLLLVLDEVQILRKLLPWHHAPAIATILDRIHNGSIGAPVILLAGGLGVSSAVFGDFGVNRFTQGCLRLLGRLSQEAERAIIRDWLLKAGGAHGDPDHLTRWMGTIAAECYGWAQHIHIYATQAARWLVDGGGLLTEQLPAEVLAEGREGRVEYYDGRVGDLDRADRVAMAKLLRQKGPNAPFTKSELIAAFQRGGAAQSAAAVFQLALHKGVVAERPDGRFESPIPSMHAWMVKEYADPPSTVYGLAV